MLGRIRAVVGRVDPTLAVHFPATLRQLARDNVWVERLMSVLCAGLACLATLLAGVGLYGALAYHVTQRTREMGLRLALGAEPGALRAMLFRQAGRVLAVGAAVGLVLALAVGRVAQAFLFGLTGYDRVFLITALGVLVAVVGAATYFPAARAARLAPMEALRHE
ncbi:MAG TPA: FtsX-like permease family protein [Gammaproteobacteria bacterium]